MILKKIYIKSNIKFIFIFYIIILFLKKKYEYHL